MGRAEEETSPGCARHWGFFEPRLGALTSQTTMRKNFNATTKLIKNQCSSENNGEKNLVREAVTCTSSRGLPKKVTLNFRTFTPISTLSHGELPVLGSGLEGQCLSEHHPATSVHVLLRQWDSVDEAS